MFLYINIYVYIIFPLYTIFSSSALLLMDIWVVPMYWLCKICCDELGVQVSFQVSALKSLG